MAWIRKTNWFDWTLLFIFVFIILELIYAMNSEEQRYQTCQEPIQYFLFSVYIMIILLRFIHRFGEIWPLYEDLSMKLLIGFILPLNLIEAIFGIFLQVENLTNTPDCEESFEKFNIWFWIGYTGLLGTVGIIVMIYLINKKCRQRRIRRQIEQHLLHHNGNLQEAMASLEQLIGGIPQDLPLLEQELDYIPTKQYYKQPGIADDQQECTICLLSFNVNEIINILHCNHQFHMSCLSKWLKCKPTCPNCRNNVRESFADNN